MFGMGKAMMGTGEASGEKEQLRQQKLPFQIHFWMTYQ